MIILSSFPNSPVFKTFPVHTKTKTRFKFILLEGRLRKAPFSGRISVDSGRNCRTKAAFSNFTAQCEQGLSGQDARWAHRQGSEFRIERSGFELWPGILCCVLGQDTLLSTQVTRYQQIKYWGQVGVNPAMDQHPIQGEQKHSQCLPITETIDKHRPERPLGMYADLNLSFSNCLYFQN